METEYNPYNIHNDDDLGSRHRDWERYARKLRKAQPSSYLWDFFPKFNNLYKTSKEKVKTSPIQKSAFKITHGALFDLTLHGRLSSFFVT